MPPVSSRSRSAVEPAHLVDPLIVAWGAVTALGTALLLYLPGILGGRSYGPAFPPLHAAAARLGAGEPLYIADAPWTASPLLPVLLSPTGGMPIEVAWLAAGALALATWTVASFLLVREAGVRDRGTARIIALAVALLPWFFAPAAETLITGSTALLAGLVVAALILALDAGRGLAAGLCLTLVIAVRPEAALFVLFLAGRRDFRTLAYAAAAGALLVALSSLVPGAGAAWGEFPARAIEALTNPAALVGDRSLAGELAAATVLPGGIAPLLAPGILVLAAIAAVLLGAGAPLWIGAPIVLLLSTIVLPVTAPEAATPLLATGVLLAHWVPMPGFLDRLLRPATWVILLLGAWCAVVAAAGTGPWFWAAVAAPFLLAVVTARSPRTP